MSRIVEMDAAGFYREVFLSFHPVVVDFYLSNCGSCRARTNDCCSSCREHKPLIEELAESYANLVAFVRMNTDEFPDVAEIFDIVREPGLLFFKDGELVGQLIGSIPSARLIDNVRQLARGAMHLEERTPV
jgi:thiol-disulfide isomerase/thioredoxin